MGLGIWAMHYIGMLAFKMPMPILYDFPTVGLSLLAAIGASAVALFIVSRQTMGRRRELIGSVVMGSESRRCITSEWRRCECRRG